MLRIGHRGACGYAPENTLASFRKAMELQVDMIELDAFSCKSGEVVVIHDEKVDRTTNGSGYVMETNYDRLEELDAGNGEKIPLLTEVLDLVKGRITVNIELKGPKTATPVSEIIDEYVAREGWSYSNFLVSSFNHYELLDFNRQSPHVPIGANIAGIPIGYAEFAQKIGARSVHPSLEFVNGELVEDAHKRGIEVYVWTVNDMDDINRMKKLGVDGIFSNYPDRL